MNDKSAISRRAFAGAAAVAAGGAALPKAALAQAECKPAIPPLPHGGFFGAPEDAELGAEQARFVRKHLKIKDRS
ncbi:MAG: hypothetical protein ACKOUT_15885 [Novosphingobium sp.]